MKTRWLKLLLSIYVLVSVYTEALPTQDNYVVLGGDYTENRLKRSVDEYATELPDGDVTMTEMRVRSVIALRYARTAVISHVRNPARRAQEVTFRMLLPDTAFISGFTMILSGKSYEAYVKEKEEAKRIYTQAVSQGIGAGHVATKARDSNHFTVTVNVEGNTTAVFELRYEEFLVRRKGLYSHVINLHPGALVPKMEVAVHIKESQKITKLHVPEITTGLEIELTNKNDVNSKAVIRRGTNDQEATITFTPDLTEQKRLAEIYTNKIKDGSSPGTVLGQFVVQYDVERTNNGEILVNNGYFVHFLAPLSLTPLSKHVVFVLDTSWSMYGRKIEQLRSAMEVILSDLNSNDYFNIVEFNSFVKVHRVAGGEDPALATPDNIAQAKRIASQLSIDGATNIYDALDKALNLIKNGIPGQNSDISIGNESNKERELEPIIIFLTDGRPVEGVTDTESIISHVTEKNTGNRKASLYSLAFGEDANPTFLRKLSLRNEGFMRHIYEAADAALQLHDFFRQVSSPLLSHVQFTYPADQIKAGTVSRSQFHTVMEGSEVAVVGKVNDHIPKFTPQVTGFCSSEDGLSRKRYEVSPTATVTHNTDEYLPLERLWAYITIKQLLDAKDAGHDQSDAEDSPEKMALDIALQYKFVTPLTSLVVVKPNETNSVEVESADKIQTASRFIPTTPAPAATSIPLSNINNLFISHQRPAVNYIHTGGMGRTMLTSGSNFQINRNYFDTQDSGDRISGGYGGGLSHHMIGNSYGESGIMYQGRSDDDYSDRSGSRVMSYVPAPRRPHYINRGHASHSRYPNYYGFIMGGNDLDDYDFGSTTQRVATTTTDPLENYHLESYAWTSSILDTSIDALTMDVNGTQVILKLTKKFKPPKDGQGDHECPLSTAVSRVIAAGAEDPQGSVCVYLTRCFAAKITNVDQYKKSYCLINNSYAGVCCPRNEVDVQ